MYQWQKGNIFLHHPMQRGLKLGYVFQQKEIAVLGGGIEFSRSQ